MEEKVLSFEELAEHNKHGDCWLLIHGKVYDVSRFLDEHPGGDEVILNVTGKDATNDFEEIGHSSFAKGLMKDFLVGKIEESNLPKTNRNDTVGGASSSSKGINDYDSSQLMLHYVLPLFITGVAFLLRYYYYKE